jgi:formamidopyrimidine-DNA glycosylase
MIATLAAILITWYATKVYYTRSLRVHIDGVNNEELVKAQCSKCARIVFTASQNLRTPFYCSSCR